MMKLVLPLLFAAALLVAGCGRNVSGTFSVVGTAKSGSGATIEPGGKINLSSTPLNIEKGKTASLKILAERKDTGIEKMFKGDIRVEFDTSDALGFKIDPVTIPAGQDSVEVTVSATATADGGGMIKVVGKGEGVEPFEFYIRPTLR